MPTEVENIILDELREARKDIKLILLNGCSKASMHEDINDRVKSLEIDRAKAIGVIATVSAIIGALSGWISRRFGE